MVSSLFAIYGWWMRNLLSSSGLFLSHLWDWIFRPTQCTSGRRRPAKYLHDIYFRRTSQQNPLSTLYLLLYPVTLNLFCYLQIFAGFPVFPSNHHNRNSALHGSHNPELQNIPKVLTSEPIVNKIYNSGTGSLLTGSLWCTRRRRTSPRSWSPWSSCSSSSTCPAWWWACTRYHGEQQPSTSSPDILDGV